MQIPARIPILYLILGVLILVSVVPMYFYAARVVAINRNSLKTNEMLLQNNLTRSLSGDISQRQSNFRTMLGNFASSVEITSGGNLFGERVSSPQMRALLERFVSSSSDFAYATLLNTESKGISAGRKEQPDAFMARDLERAFAAGLENRPYSGQPLSVGSAREQRVLMLLSQPVISNGNVIGIVAGFVDLEFLVKRLDQASQGGLLAYVVDQQGRLVASASASYATGQDMTDLDIVRNFAEQGGRVNFVVTKEFSMKKDRISTDMLGTYSPVQELGWAVVAQKAQRDAYQGVFEMQRTAKLLAVLAVLISIMISIFAARRITGPLQVLTESSRAIAKGDFSQRVALRSRTEIGELADTFNKMSDELERFVEDLKRAAEENRNLFLNSIQMLAGAVDEKDPYTRGHSDRVTRYSVMLATDMGLSNEEIEKVRVAAQLHDVGKIGIEDRVLKKPGALTPEEYEIMKTHTTKGANMLRPVPQLADMIPGIELHHESLDGRGYPLGLKGEEIPVTARIIMVADTYDAMTTDRPYQAAMDPEYVVRIINSLAGTKFDPKAVEALTAIYERGDIGTRPATMPAEPAIAAAAGPEPAQ